MTRVTLTQVDELLTALPAGVRCAEFSEAFARRYGRYVDPGRMGFSGGVVDLLRSMGDTLLVDDSSGCYQDWIVKKRPGTFISCFVICFIGYYLFIIISLFIYYYITHVNSCYMLHFVLLCIICCVCMK